MSETTIRNATANDAEAISDVLIRSITALCAADHQDNPDLINGWIANKTPTHIREWLTGDLVLLVSEAEGRPGAVGGFLPDGTVSLLYVAPEARGQGHSGALLNAMEQRLMRQGISTARLVSTKTAQGFYESRGWSVEGSRVACYTTDGQPMCKVLEATNA